MPIDSIVFFLRHTSNFFLQLLQIQSIFDKICITISEKVFFTVRSCASLPNMRSQITSYASAPYEDTCLFRLTQYLRKVDLTNIICQNSGYCMFLISVHI